MALERLEKICAGAKIESVDRNINTFEKAVGIEDIRTIQKKLYLKPIKSKQKAVVIEATFGITLSAQNSLLKILEEPPENTFIILIVSTKNELIPTVLSRCSVIEAKEIVSFDEDELSKISESIAELKTSGVGGKLKLAQDFGTSREEALIFLEKAIIAQRRKMIENPDDLEMLRTLEEFQQVYPVLKNTNATVRLTLENLFLSL